MIFISLRSKIAAVGEGGEGGGKFTSYESPPRSREIPCQAHKLIEKRRRKRGRRRRREEEEGEEKEGREGEEREVG